jgi:CBS domain-containing protein
MNRDIPTVGDYMTPGAYVVASHETVSEAKNLMRDHGIRHLPVMTDGKLVGVVSDRDLAEARALRAGDAPVEDAMTRNPFTATPGTLLNVVARTMAKRKCGSAVVVDRDGVVGVFTTSDAMEALSDALEGKASRRSTETIGAQPPTRTRRAKLSAGEREGRPLSRA